MKSLYIKIALLGVIGVIHSSSECMLQKRGHHADRKPTKEVQKIASELQKYGSRTDFSRLPLDQDNTDPNCFMQLSKDERGRIYAALRPSDFKNPFFPLPRVQKDPLREAHLDRCRKIIWLGSIRQLRMTCKSLYVTVAHEDREMATFLGELNVARSLGYISSEQKKVVETTPEPEGWCRTQ